MLFTEPYFFVFILFVLLLLSFGNRLYKKVILLLSSYFFYGFWDWRFLSLIWISTIVDFSVGKVIYSSTSKAKRKFLLFLSIFTNLSILGFFKYCNFFIDSFNHLVGITNYYSTFNIILPIGISFYTFQTMSYTLDIYNGRQQPTRSLLDFSNFIAFFPQLIAGPIEKAKSLLCQLEKFDGVSFKYINNAIILLFLGYVKKVLISDNIAPIIDHNFSNYFLLDSYQMLFALILFSIQIYFDFSGYSDIARGLAFLFGIKLIINFKQPYFSTSPSDFWQRWHISLSTWLRDYLYIPLGGNRKGYIRTNINLMVTMLLGGLWHGASWNFVFWGGLHGIYLIIYKLFRIKISTNNKFPFFYKLLKIFLMYLLILITWLPFRTEDIHTTLIIFNKFLFWSGNVNIANLILIIFLFVLLLIIDLPLYYFGTELYLIKLPKCLLWALLVIGIFGITLSIIINQGSVRPFIYFQF